MWLKHRQNGMSLLEVLIALAISALLMTGINSAISLGLQSKAYAHDTNEMAYSARFALSRIITQVRAGQDASVSGLKPNQILTITTATGTNIVYARNVTNQLTETIGAGASTVLADYVTAFAASKLTRLAPPANYGAMPAGPSLTPSVIDIDLSIQKGGQAISVSADSRIGPL